MQAVDEDADFARSQEIGDSMDFDDQSYDGGDYDSGAGSGLTRTRTRSGSGSSSGSSSRSVSSWSAGSSWVYVDPHGNHQGPHDTQAIKKWIAGGWFAPDVLVKPAGPGDEFLPMDVRLRSSRTRATGRHRRRRVLAARRRRRWRRRRGGAQAVRGTPSLLISRRARWMWIVSSAPAQRRRGLSGV